MSGDLVQLWDRYDDLPPGVFVWLQAWYANHANGEWEHGNGITIRGGTATGWSVEIDLRDTVLAHRPYDGKEVQRSESDWCVTRTVDGKFVGSCGPVGLAEVLYEFRLWAQGLTEPEAIVLRDMQGFPPTGVADDT